jgi:hypothetical protein
MVQLMTTSNLRSPARLQSDAGILGASGLLETASKLRPNEESCVQPITGIPTEPEMALTGCFIPGPSPGDEGQDLLLVQMRHEEHLARYALQELFESGQLEGLCG